jgi:hypothetical protein
MDYADREDGVAVRFLTPKGASKRYGVAVQTFANWRSQGAGPPFHKISPGKAGRVRYDLIELDRWFGDESASASAEVAE